MDDSDFQIEDPGPRIRKLPARARKQLSGVFPAAPRDSSGEMPAASPAPLRASEEIPAAAHTPPANPLHENDEVPFANPTFRSSGEFPAADRQNSGQSGEVPAMNPWRDSVSEEIPSGRPNVGSDVRPADSSGEIRAARLSNSSGEIPAVTLDKSGDPQAAGGRSDRNSKLREQRSQSIERRRSSGEWRVSGEHRISEERRSSEERPTPEERRGAEDRRSSEERRSSTERRVADEFRIASEERRKSVDRRSRQPYTETSPHLTQSGEQPTASAEYRAQPLERTHDSSAERWALLQDRRARSGDRPAAPEERISPSQERSSQPEELRSLTGERRQPGARPPQERSSQPEELRFSAPPSRFIGPFTITALSVLLIAYAFSYSTIQTAAETIVAGWNSPDQLEGSTLVAVAQRTIPYLVMLPPLFLLYGVLTSVAGFIGLRRSKRQKERSKQGGKVSPLDRFKEQAESEGVRPRYAYQAFLLLEQHLPNGHELSIGDGLENDLALSPAQVRTVRMSLLQNTDRAVDPNGRLAPVDTVLAMLLSAQQTPRRQRDPLDPVFVPGDPKTGRNR